MDQKAMHVGKMEKQLQSLRAKLDALSEKAKAAGADARDEQRKLIAELKAKRHAVQMRLGELKAAGTDKWDTIRVDVENA